MNTLKNKQFYFNLVLACLCFCLLIVMVIDLNRDFILPPTKISNVQQQEKYILKKNSHLKAPIKPIDAYERIVTRPLFMDNRRPPVAKKVIAKTKEPKKQRESQEEFLLSAIFITEDKRISLLQSKNSKKLHKVFQGDDLNGWKVTAIEPRLVSLKRGGEVRKLELMVKTSKYSANEMNDVASQENIVMTTERTSINSPTKEMKKPSNIETVK
ncbi:MAG: hypothetical protein GKR93_17955 [Gammaproteobacteria bacterium]|nr:hypothetical protein [Gammaproteobacteria bacterium]